MPEETSIGVVIQYFGKVGVAAVQITDGELAIGDRIRIKGATTDFEQSIESMQIDKNPVQNAKAGQAVGIKVQDRVRPNDRVFVLS